MVEKSIAGLINDEATMQKNIERLLAQLSACDVDGHPADSVSRIYNPKTNVTYVHCHRCLKSYDDAPTAKEVKDYQDLLNTRITI